MHVGHDSIIGQNCLFAAHVGIAGVVTIEDNVTLWGQVGIAADLTIGAGTVLLGQSGLNRSVEANKTYFGSPAQEAKERMKDIMNLKRIPRLLEKLR